MSKKRDRSKKNQFGLGRPHSGLSNPAKFGLTYEAVLDLIESGQWRSFYDSWRKGYEYQPLRCKVCNNLLVAGEYLTILNVTICTKCIEEVSLAARIKINAKLTKKIT